MEQLEEEYKKYKTLSKRIKESRKKIKDLELKKELEMFEGKIRFPLEFNFDSKVVVRTFRKEEPYRTTLSLIPHTDVVRAISGICGGIIFELGSKYYEGSSEKNVNIKIIIDEKPCNKE